MPVSVGTATARPGHIVTGWFDAVMLPTGIQDRFPVIIAEGPADGPVMWLTTGIHGTEHTGLISLHRLLVEDIVADLRGTLVIIPALSPAGLRTKNRLPYYHQGDPNRIFPAPETRDNSDNGPRIQSALEDAFNRLFEQIIESQPACVIDLHNAWIGSLPFAFRDPVFYRRGRNKRAGLNRTEALALQEKTGELLDVFGFTIVNEYAAEDYVGKNLHRSVSGSILNAGGMPAFTVELGSWMHVDPAVPDACGMAIKNVMRHIGMLDGKPQPVEGIPVIKPGYPVRRQMTPRMPQAGIVHHLVRPGEMIYQGKPLARITDIFGNPVGKRDGILRSEHEGFVLGWQHGVIHYQSDAIMALAIRDEGNLVVAYPE